MAIRNIELNREAIISATQGGADNFKEGSVSTGLNSASTFAWLIKRITFQLSVASLLSSSNYEVTMAVSRATKAAIPNLTDTDVICLRSVFQSLTTSGASALSGVIDWEAPPGLLVVQSNLYLDIDSTSTGNAQTIIAKVHYDLVELNKVDFLTLLTAS